MAKHIHIHVGSVKARDMEFKPGMKKNQFPSDFAYHAARYEYYSGQKAPSGTSAMAMQIKANQAENEAKAKGRDAASVVISPSLQKQIGTVGSEHREDMPANVFLEPASRKYPVKEKEDGAWKWSRKLLLAAAREARMHGDELLARRADEIRAREFGADE